jgi:hypothetical protein
MEKKFDTNSYNKQKKEFETIKKQEANNPSVLRNELKKDIRKKLKECKVPKSKNEEAERKTLLLKKREL